MEQQTGKVTLANMVAIVGIALLLVFSFLGRSFTSGGELGWDIIIAVAITAFSALLLWFLIKAKTAENNLDKWKKVELIALIVYIVFAVPASLFGGIMHFFVVNDQKQSIKEYAVSDLEAIDAVIEEYRDFESYALSKTGTGLSNATRPGAVCDRTLNAFMEENNISHTTESAANFETIQRNILIGTGFDAFYEAYESQKDEILNVVESWSMMKIPFQAHHISDLAITVSERLTELSEGANLPFIERGSDGKYTISDENQSRAFSVDVESFEFKKHLQEATGFSILALFVVLLIHFLILFNYFVAYRTRVVRPGSGYEEDGGRVL